MIPVPHGGRFLPAVASGHELASGEPVGVGLARITAAQFDAAIQQLRFEEPAEAAHAARTRAKRLRAILRLVRRELGEERYRFENAALRDAARMLAPLREADVRIATVRLLRERFAAQMSSGALDGVERRFVAERRRVLAEAEDEHLVGRAVYELRKSQARFRAWPVDRSSHPVAGTHPLDDAFRSIRPGLRRTYARGRKEMAAALARPTGERMHQWRKRVKYLRYQLEVVTPAWPDVLEAHVRALDHLGGVLGDEHDLADLIHLVAADPSVCPDPVERSFLIALIRQRRLELQAEAERVGRKAYAETPGRFVERVGSYWDEWRRRPVELV